MVEGSGVSFLAPRFSVLGGSLFSQFFLAYSQEIQKAHKHKQFWQNAPHTGSREKGKNLGKIV